MDDYEPWLTPCDPDFDPEKCESAYALWAVKEEGEPVKFLEASITDNLDYPSGYWFFWRTISFSEETGRLIEGEWGGAGDICRADYVADMVLPGGAVFARVQGELDDGIPFDWEVRRPLDDCAKTRAAEAIRAGILALPLSASASIEALGMGVGVASLWFARWLHMKKASGYPEALHSRWWRRGGSNP